MNESNLPVEMIEDLAACATATEADKIFEDWADECYIELKDRAKTWLTAEEI